MAECDGFVGRAEKRQRQQRQQVLRLTTPRLRTTPGAPFAQDDSIHGNKNDLDQ
jgi:hypothetical protein